MLLQFLEHHQEGRHQGFGKKQEDPSQKTFHSPPGLKMCLFLSEVSIFEAVSEPTQRLSLE